MIHCSGCPIDENTWNQKVLRHEESSFEPAEGLLEMGADDWQQMDDEAFNRRFEDSPLQRADLEKIKNILEFL